jgi:hypothetical protein
VLTISQCAKCTCFQHRCFLSRYERVTSTEGNSPIWNQMILSPHWKLWCAGSIPFKKWVKSLMETVYLNPVPLTRMVFFLAMHVFLQLRWIGPLGTQWAHLQLETYARQEVFLSKTDSVLQGKQCARSGSLQHKWFLCRHAWISSTHLNRPNLWTHSLPARWHT